MSRVTRLLTYLGGVVQIRDAVAPVGGLCLESVCDHDAGHPAFWEQPEVFNLNIPNVRSNLLTLGMPLEEVIRRATVNAARTYSDFRELGTLRPGAVADIAVLELRAGDFTFVDNYKGTRNGRKKLFAKAAFFAGKRTYV